MLLAAHASGHTSHQLTVRIDGKVSLEGNCDLFIECLDGGCGSPRKQVAVRTLLELVSTHAIGFHTGHEGHAFRLLLDGKQIIPVQ
jgi:hypothetical protein